MRHSVPTGAAAIDANAALASELGFDHLWVEALHEISRRYSPGDSLLAPVEFLHFFRTVYPIHIRRSMIPSERIDWFLLHKGMLERVDRSIAEEALGLPAHFANEVFALFGQREGKLPDEQKNHLQPVLEWKKNLGTFAEVGSYAALVTTFERPTFLERCLESLVGQFNRILIVDDGSEAVTRDRNTAAASRAGVDYVHLGRNRGHACAINVGLAMLLADLEIGWISKFDDDTELVSGGIARLKLVTRACGTAGHRNLYSCYARPEHLVHCEETILGERVLICRSCSGQHMHAHRSYWERVMPIPTPYARAPKSAGGIFSGQGSDSDRWCSNWAPRSAVKMGGWVCVLPGLVRNHGEDYSTWSKPA
jgi:hypothetical protein